MIQSRIYLKKKELKNDSNWSKRFIKLFTNRRVSTAMSILRDGEIEHPILQNNDVINDMLVREKLEQLHSSSEVASSDKILEIPLPRVVPHRDAMFADIEPSAIKLASRRTHGVQGHRVWMRIRGLAY
ncbi:hypothetical protein GJ496_006473 [Pomphorhynchus laevis]|nr:hypothetical protein GJ496_006473 [Pomphorhynchus laevis]